MQDNKKSAEQEALGEELDGLLGPDEFKALGQDLALVFAKHKLTTNVETCCKALRYMSFVIAGWNCVKSKALYGSYGFAGALYNQVIVFNSSEAMDIAIAANPHMTAIMGADDYTRSAFPGVYIAGIMNEASQREDILADGQTAIQK